MVQVEGGVVRLSERVCVLRGSGTVWHLNGNWCFKTVRLIMPREYGLPALKRRLVCFDLDFVSKNR